MALKIECHDTAMAVFSNHVIMYVYNVQECTFQPTLTKRPVSAGKLLLSKMIEGILEFYISLISV